MNGIEQKRHTTRVDEVERAILRVETSVLDALEALRHLIDQERTARLKLADEQRSYVDRSDRELRQVADERWQANADAHIKMIAMSDVLRCRRFLGRLKWLVRGL